MTPKELRTRRIALGLSVRQLADELGLTQTELQSMERAQSPLPTDETIRAILDALEKRAMALQARDCLVVEDDDAVREIFVRALRAQGLTVDEAADGLAAIDATTRRDYRLLLLDLKLPKFSGAEVLDRIVTKPHPPANVIIISAAGSGDVREVAGHRSVHAIMRKAYAIANADVIFPALAALARA